MVTIEVYTHPACVSCKDAMDVAKDFAADREDVSVSMVSLASDSGKKKATELGILVVPAVLVGEEVIEKIPTEEELDSMVAAEAA